ncbi:MAG: thioredoxin domain-containing protein [Elusimicrobiales bacterium]|jgi:protein-disulfide isomerase
MFNRTLARKFFAAGLLVFAVTLAVLLCRQFSLAPARPSPEFRAFGPKNATIQIYEYTDFSCPACKAAETHVMKILEVYRGSVRVNFKHYPLPTIHPWSFQAAAYADCAGAQGRFMEYAALLFENQEQWAFAKSKPAQFASFAAELKLDLPALESCAAAPETARRVKLDISEGDLRGVNATPTFFINGKRAVGGTQFLDQAKKFDNLLNKNR